MLHFNRKIYLIPNWPFHLWFGNHVVSFRFIKANISRVMKGCFKLSRHHYICSSSCLKILFHLNICLLQITKYNCFSFEEHGIQYQHYKCFQCLNKKNKNIIFAEFSLKCNFLWRHLFLQSTTILLVTLALMFWTTAKRAAMLHFFHIRNVKKN